MLLVSPTGVSGTRVDAYNLRAGRDLHLSRGGLEGSVRFQQSTNHFEAPRPGLGRSTKLTALSLSKSFPGTQWRAECEQKEVSFILCPLPPPARRGLWDTFRPKVVTRPLYQTQKLSMTENDFLFLIRQKKQLLRK